MKHLAGLILVALFAFSCNNQNSDLSALRKSDLEESNLKGKVSKIQKTIHTVGDNCRCPAAEKDECSQASFMYNEKGYLIESCDIDNNGNIDFTYKYLYNKHDECLEIDKFSGDQLMGKEVNILKEGRITEVKEFNEMGINEKIYKYEYLNNDVSGGKILNKSGDVVTSFQNEYKNGQLASQMEKDSIGDILSIVKYKWNTHNDKIETITTFPKAESEYQLTYDYEYDEAGNWVKQTLLFNGEVIKIVMREITYYDDNEIVSL